MPSTSSVTIHATHKVQCTDISPLAQISCPFPLGPFDHLLPPSATIAVVFVWRQPLLPPSDGIATNGSHLIPFDLLHKSFSRLLDFYPHLTGRVQLNSEDGSPEIYSLGEGARLQSAVCDTSLPGLHHAAQLSPDDMPGQGSALLPGYNGSLENLSNEPILSIQHTRFTCGSVALGVRVNHTVCDARGFLHLVEDLAQIYRGLKSGMSVANVRPQDLPCITSYMSDVVLSPLEREEALASEPADYHVEHEHEHEQAPTQTEMFKSDKPVAGKLLHFSSGELMALKEKATSSSPRDQGQWISTFSALSAHLWQSVQRARKILHQRSTDLASDEHILQAETADLLTSLDWRHPTRLDLPSRYFPNAVSEPYITLSLTNLSTTTLGQTAQTIQQTLRSRTPANQQETLHWVLAQHDKHRIRLRSRLNGNENPFIVSQWNKLDLYGVAFDTDLQGDGVYPDRAFPPFTADSLLDGLAYFLPTRSGDGIEVALSLHEPVWEVLEKDGEFRAFSGL